MKLLRRVLVFAFVFNTACASVLAPRVSAAPEALRKGGYELDRDHAALLFKVGHMGFSKYVGRFNRFDVSLDFDESDPSAARVDSP